MELCSLRTTPSNSRSKNARSMAPLIKPRNLPLGSETLRARYTVQVPLTRLTTGSLIHEFNSGFAIGQLAIAERLRRHRDADDDRGNQQSAEKRERPNRAMRPSDHRQKSADRARPTAKPLPFSGGVTATSRAQQH